MLRRVVTIAAVVVLGAHPFATGQTGRAADARREIRPGRAIGALRLGMSRAEAVRAMGRPRETHRIGTGIREYRWYAGRIEREDQDIPYLAAWLREGRVIQIEVTSPEYTTAGGIGARSALSQIRAAYPDTVALVYKGPDGGATYLGSRQSGICFCFATSEKVSEQDRLDSIIVHPAGRAVAVRPDFRPAIRPFRIP